MRTARLGKRKTRRFHIESLEGRHLLTAGPTITEFVASNDNSLDDGDGNSSDWIEIFNTDQQAVDLAGYRLTTDSSGESDGWVFPSYILEPGAYGIVFASGQADADYVDPAGNLHTNFTLPANGGHLALAAPDGTLVSEFGGAQPTYPRQLSDVSYGVSQRQIIIDPTSPALYAIPLDGSLGTDWLQIDFDAAARGFTEGTAAIGFESKPDDRTNFVGQFTTELPGRTHGVYTRIQFDLADASAITDLTLRLKYDNGFVAYINGHKVAEDNAPANPSWFSPAPESRPRDSDVLEFVQLDLQGHRDKLVDGPNVLAIHGMNHLPDNTDMLLVAELSAVASDPLAAFGTPAKVGYMTRPSPAAANVSDADVRSGFVTDTQFSIDRGFFDSPFEVEIASATPDATIRYTTDGTAPTQTHGAIYSGPITVSTTTTLRAAALKDDFIPTNVDTQTYLFLADVVNQPNDPGGYPTAWGGRTADYEMDPEVVGPDNVFNNAYRDTIVDDLKSLPTLSLVFDPEHMFGGNGIYQRPTSEGDAWERPTSVEFMSPDGSEDGFHINSGIRIMGGSSRQTDIPKHSFRLEFREKYGQGKLKYPLYDGQPFGEDATDTFDELVVRTGFNNSWMHRHYYQGERGEQPRDQWVRDLQFAMGHHSTRGRFSHVYLNGMYWGVYNLQERPAEPLMAEYFGQNQGTQWDVINSGDAVDGDTVAWNGLNTLADRGVRTAEAYAAIAQQLDIVNLIDYMILNFYVGNTDWDGHNWIATRPRTQDGQFRIYAWDSEFAISLAPSNTATGENAERQIINTDRTTVRGDDQPSNLHQKLSQYAEYRLLFADRVHKHMFQGGVLTPQEATRIFLERSDEIDRAVVAESARWGDFRRDVYNRWTSEQFDLFHRDEHYVDQRQFIVERYLPVRTDIVVGQLDRRRLYPDTVAPSFNQHGGAVTSGFDLTMAAGETATIYFTTDGSDPRDAATDRPSANAQDYLTTIPLADSQTVRARALEDGEWSALNEATFYVNPADTNNLRVTEVNYNPPPPTATELASIPDADNDDFEFIEVQNIGTTAISLAGVRIDDGVDFVFPSVPLEPGAYAVAVRDREAFQLRYGTQASVLGTYTGGLNNGGERLGLLDAQGEPLVQLTYDDNDLWPARADGLGGTLELVDPASMDANRVDKHTSWRGSSQFGGSPGASNPEPVGVLINEVLTNPDSDLHPRDAIELFNPTAAEIDMSGWFLSDSANNLLKFAIPAGTKIGGGQYFVLDERDFNPTPNNPSADHFGLSGSRGDDVWLIVPDDSGGVARWVDDVRFGAAVAGESFGRVADQDRGLAPLSSVTLGGLNTQPRVGPILISEVNYDPGTPSEAARDIDSTIQSDDLEFVEIYNPTESPVELANWRLRGGIDFDFSAPASLAPGEPILVLPFNPTDANNDRRLAAFRAHYGMDDQVRVVGGYQGGMNNNGEIVRLLRPNQVANDPTTLIYTLDDQITYDPRTPWPTEASGTGQSLVRQTLHGWGNWPISWSAATPTPGSVDALFDQIGDANNDGQFDSHDLVTVLAAGKYLSGQPATWEDGDWNGDGVFDQLDLVLALQRGDFLAG